MDLQRTYQLNYQIVLNIKSAGFIQNEGDYAILVQFEDVFLPFSMTAIDKSNGLSFFETQHRGQRMLGEQQKKIQNCQNSLIILFFQQKNQDFEEQRIAIAEKKSQQKLQRIKQNWIKKDLIQCTQLAKQYLKQFEKKKKAKQNKTQA